MSERVARPLGTPLLYRPVDAAPLLATSESTLRRLHQEGAIQGVLVGAELRFAHADLVAYVERLRREAAALGTPAPIRRRRSA